MDTADEPESRQCFVDYKVQLKAGFNNSIFG